MLEPAIQITSKVETYQLNGEYAYFLHGKLAMDNQNMEAPETTGAFQFKAKKEDWDAVKVGDIVFFSMTNVQSLNGEVN